MSISTFELIEQAVQSGQTSHYLAALYTWQGTPGLIPHTYRAENVFTLKGNQPIVHAQVLGLLWADVSVADKTIDANHGLVVIPELQVAPQKGKVLSRRLGLVQPDRPTAIRIVQ